MPATVEVRFKGNRKDYFLWPDDAEPLRLQDPVIVPVDRGLDFGRVDGASRLGLVRRWPRQFTLVDAALY